MLLYIITDSKHFKNGITSTSIEKRIAGIQTGNPNEVSLFKAYEDDRASELEKSLHAMFSHKRLTGEWFDFDETDLIMLKAFLDCFSKEYTLPRRVEIKSIVSTVFDSLPIYEKRECKWCGADLKALGKSGNAKFCTLKHKDAYWNLKTPVGNSKRIKRKFG